MVSGLGLLPSTFLDMLWFCFLEGSPALGFWISQYLFCSEDLPLRVLFCIFFLVLCFDFLLSPSAAERSFYKGVAWLMYFGSFTCIPVKTDWDFQWAWVWIPLFDEHLHCTLLLPSEKENWSCLDLHWSCMALSVRNENTVRMFFSETNAKCWCHLF